MVNGNYVLYGDRPSSESEIVNDHVQTRTAERKNRRKTNRTANELQRTLNMAQLDNETDSVKYEKKIKEPRLLRYVSTSDVEENFVNEKFETYDLKPTEERPRRYAFQKKPKNPADGSVNYAYSRSSSSCSSPNGNLPTISEHGEQYGTYRVRSAPSPAVGDFINAYESKIDKYFTKPKESKGFAGKISYKGSHPDSLYRVPSGAGVGGDKMARVLRVLRWPVALVAVCIALAVFVYFLMPDNIDRDLTAANRTYWEPIAAGASHGSHGQKHHEKPDILPTPYGTKTPEIDFYDAENEKVDFTSIMDPKITETKQRILPIKPVFPEHIAPEVQYGNEKADSEKLRMAKALEEANRLPQDSTLKPHITQKPEKPLAVYFKEGHTETTTTTEAITRAETINEFTNYGDKQISKIIEEVSKTYGSIHKEPAKEIPLNIKQYLVTEPEITRESQDYYSHQPGDVHVKFTSGHSNLFGISIEDAEKMRSTTQSSLYNTRVSPTLPTWRDGDDTTTKKYPVNVNYEVPQCRSTRLSVCRGVLPYDLAGAPATISDVEVTTFLPQIEYLISTNCSERVKHFACSLMEPECSPPPYPPKMPCYNLCKAILDSCDGFIPHELMPAFKCGQYSRTNCIGARVPCYHREFTCSDQSCVPRDWMCDGTNDCPNGEDELSCAMCEKNEFRCRTGTCILKRWLCDGYSDCPGGEDETENCDRHLAGEPGEESAGSAPAPAVRRPNRLSGVSRTAVVHRTTGESDSSKELLITSDSSHSFKRNFTRRPSPSRLSPYSRTSVTQTITHKSETVPAQIPTRKIESRQKPEPPKMMQKPENNESQEDVNIGDLGFLDDIKKTSKEATDELKKTNEETRSKEAMPMPQMEQKAQPKPKAKATKAPVAASTVPPRPTKLDKSLNKMEKVINGAALLKQIAAEEETNSPETNSTTFEPEDLPPIPEPKSSRTGSKSAHASPCPSGELRCVDGRCITLAQLCDGTIDCSDHADEDNCFT